MSIAKPYNTAGNMQPYVPPVVQKFSHYRTTDNSRVFYVPDVNTLDYPNIKEPTPHVIYAEWGKLQPLKQPYSLWEKAIKEGLLVPFRPSVQDYIFIDHKKRE